ncbi:PP2C family protein-serine/threonine phosphatase [soil metagenome]
MARIDVSTALRRARLSGPATIPEILAQAATEVGATDVVVYLVDFGQTTLEPLPDRSVHAEVPSTEAVATTIAGRAFTDEQVVIAPRDDGVRVWAPVLEGSDRTGVVAATLRSDDAETIQAIADLGLLAGYLIAAQARCTDVYNLYRRRRSMKVAASMQWDLLPPLVLRTSTVSVAGLVEPAYDVGGDCFDYADNGPMFDLSIMDAMGHGLHSAVLANLAMGSYRHQRREGHPLPQMHGTLGATLAAEYDDASFVTGILARIDVVSGELTWTNAGHPAPLLVRGGKVVRELKASATSPPWGIGPGRATVGTERLEPDDLVLLYTDGVVEARTPTGEEFGLDRLVDLTQNHASDLLRPQEIVRRLVGQVLEHQATELRDDATVVLVRWEGPSSG